jgi:hypothetical protein
MRFRLQSVKFLLLTGLIAWALCAVQSPEALAQGRRPKIPYEYEGFKDTNWVCLFDGKSLSGWLPLELGGSGPVEFEAEFKTDKQTNTVPAILIHRGDMLSGMAWTNGPPRMNYEIEWEAMRVDGNDFFAAMGFAVNDSYASFIPSGWGGSVAGISCVDNRDASENETSSYLPLEDKVWHKFKLRVTEKKVEAWANEKKIIDLRTEDKELSLRSGSPAEIKRYGIVCTVYRSTGAIKDIRMRKIKIDEEK